LLKAGKADEALVMLNTTLAENPKDAVSYNLLCRVYFQLELWDNAIHMAEKSISLDPQNSSYHLWLGRAQGRKAENANPFAAFGLARACLATGDRPGAIAALAAVPETSSYHAAAQIAAVRILVSSGMTGDDLHQASGRLGRLALDEARRQQLTVEILRAALGWAEDSGQAPARTAGDGLILGCEPNERSLRFGLERGYRALARLTSDRSRRIELVDMANAVRPKTWS